MDPSQDGNEGESNPPFELKDIVYAILRSKTWILIFAFLGLCWGVYSGASKPNVYTSKAKLHLRLGARESYTAEDLVGARSSRLETRTGIEDELHMLTAHSLYEKLALDIGPVDILRPADPKRHITGKESFLKRAFHHLQAFVLKTEDPPPPAEPGAPVNETLIKRATVALMKNTNIGEEYGSNVISIHYTSTSEEKAQRHLSLILQGFLQRHLEHYSMIGDREAAEESMNAARAAYEAAQADYYGHLAECNLPSVETSLSEVVGELQAIDSDIFRDNLRRSEIEIEIAALRKKLESMPLTTSVPKPAVTRPNEDRVAALALKSTYVSRKGELQFLNITITERQEREAFYDQRIAELDKEIEGMERVIVESAETNEEVPNEERKLVMEELLDFQTEDEALVVKLDTLKQRKLELEKKNADMLNCKFEHIKRDGDITDKRRVLDAQRETYDELAALASLDVEKKTNLTILEPASLPANKSGPSRGKLVVVGLMGGAMLASGLAVLRQLMESKMRYPHVVARTLRVPVIAVVRERRSLRALRKAPRPEVPQVRQVPQVTGAG